MSGGKPTCVAWDEQPLGYVPDSVLAYKNDVTASAARQARISRRIPPMDGQRTLLRVPIEIEMAMMREFPGADLHVAIHLVLQRWMEGRSDGT